MADILSQNEIDDLLNEINKGKLDLEEVNYKRENANNKNLLIKDYDFYAPKKFIKEHFKIITNIHQDFSRELSSLLSTTFRYFSQATVLSVEEQKYYEYSNSISDNVFVALYDIVPTDSNINNTTMLIDVSNDVAFSIIERLLGGEISNYFPDREFTEIEIAILKNIIEKFVNCLKKAWQSYISSDIKLLSIFTSSKLMQFVLPEDTVIIVVIEIKIENLVSKITICLPTLNLEQVLKNCINNLSFQNLKKESDDRNKEKDCIFDNLKKSSLNIVGVLDEIELTLEEIISLKEGDIIVLNKNINQNSLLTIEGKPWFEVKVGSNKNKKAIKIEKFIT